MFSLIRSKAGLISLSVFSLISVAHATSTEEVIVQYPETEAVDLGMGWNLHKDTSVPNVCIKNYEKYSVDKNIKDEGFEQGNNSFTLNSQLGVSYKSRVKEDEKVGGSSVGESADAQQSSSVDLAASFDMSKDDRYIIASQKLVSRWDALKSSGGLIELTDDAIALVPGSDAFYDVCGHGYVARIEYGGEFHALFNMHKTSYTATSTFKLALQQKSKVKEDAVAEKGSVSESTNTDVSNTNSVDSQQQDVSIKVTESGGAASSAGTDIDSVLQQYATFPSRVGEAPTEFLLAVMPYPQSTDLSELQAPYMVLSREFGKWLYLSRQIGKMIASEHASGVPGYIFIDGVTSSKEDLEHLQEMTQAKLDIISTVMAACSTYVTEEDKPTQAGLESACSLSGQQVDFTYHDKKSGAEKTSKVDVLESDIYYLVRLPFSKNIYDGQIATGDSSSSNGLTYQDVIFNQVNGIYRERCGNNYIAHYCESEAKIEEAVNTYIGDAQGVVYYQYRSFDGQENNLCVNVAKMGDQLTNDDCATAAYFAVDDETEQVKVRFPGNMSKTPDGCLQSATDTSKNSGYAHYVSLQQCQKDAQHSNDAYQVYWDIQAFDSDDKSRVMLADKNYASRAKTTAHTNCLDVSGNTTTAGTTVWDYLCKSTTDSDKNQRWIQQSPQFFLE